MLDLLSELHRANGAGVRVAIVDSGVDGSHPWVGDRLQASYRAERSDEGYQVLPCPADDQLGHGTAVAGTLRRFAPEAELISVQVLGSGLRADSEALLAALRWLVSQDIHLINLSLSTMREQLALRLGHAIDDLAARYVTCVCARGYHLTGRAYPTDFASVVSVSYKEQHPAGITFRPKDTVEFDACGVNLEVAWVNEPGTTTPNPSPTRIVQGSSFACPLVTGLSARLLSLRPNLTPYELKTLLKAYAEKQAAGWWEPWMDDVAKTPHNKDL
jgi:subtilisin